MWYSGERDLFVRSEKVEGRVMVIVIRVCFQKHKSKRKLKEYAVRQRKPKGKQAVDVE